MKRATTILLTTASLGYLLCSCNDENQSDAFGNFEATEVIISSESTGRLISFEVEEGQKLKPGDMLGYIDTTQLHLKRQQLKASKAAIEANIPDIIAQIDAIEEKKKVLLVELNRVIRLLKDSAATTQQLDDISGKIRVLEKQKHAIETKNAPVLNQAKAMNAQISQIDDLIAKSVITNHVEGTVLIKYAEAGELTAAGKPLYKIANLDKMYLKAWVDESQLSEVKLGQTVQILTDASEGQLKTLKGKITWISSEAEFSPKNIQTREDRVSEVYAIKIRTENDGSLKIGLPGEVVF